MVYRIRSSKLGILQSVVMRGVVQAHHDAGDVLLGENEGEAPTPVLEEVYSAVYCRVFSLQLQFTVELYTVPPGRGRTHTEVP